MCIEGVENFPTDGKPMGEAGTSSAMTDCCQEEHC